GVVARREPGAAAAGGPVRCLPRRREPVSAMTTTAVPVLAAGSYRIDPATSLVRFTTKHLFGLGAVAGTFRIRSGHVRIGADPLTSTATAVVDSASFRTDKARRDRDVTSKAFLDADNHPTIEVRLSEVRVRRGGCELGGELLVKDVSAPITLMVSEI